MQSKTAWALRQVSTLPHRESDGKFLLFVSAVCLFCGVGILHRYDNIIAQTRRCGNRRSKQFFTIVFGQSFSHRKGRIGELGRAKRKRAEKPTQHNHQTTKTPSKSTAKWGSSGKLVFRTKTVVCIWRTFRLEKLKKPCYLIVNKRSYKNSKSSGGLPKDTVNHGNHSDFNSK